MDDPAGDDRGRRGVDDDASDGEGSGADGTSTADPFAGLTLDDDFVRSATVSEAGAEQRRNEVEDRRRRDADLRRRLEQDAGGGSAVGPESQRLAPSGWDDDSAWDDEDEPRPRRRSTTVRTVAIVLIAALVGTYAVTHLLVILAG